MSDSYSSRYGNKPSTDRVDISGQNDVNPYSSPEDYTWRWVRGKQGNPALTITLKNLLHYTKHAVTVRAMNEVGAGPMAVPVMVTTREAGM